MDPDGRYKKYLNVAGGSAEFIGLDGAPPAEVVLTEGELDYHTLRILLPYRACVAAQPGPGAAAGLQPRDCAVGRRYPWSPGAAR